MNGQNTEAVTQIVNLLLKYGPTVWEEIRRIAVEAGVSADQLAAWDALFTHIVPDPTLPAKPDPTIGDAPPVNTPPANPPLPVGSGINYFVDLVDMPDTTLLYPGDTVYLQPNGKYQVGRHGIRKYGFPGDGWALIYTKP